MYQIRNGKNVTVVFNRHEALTPAKPPKKETAPLTHDVLRVAMLDLRARNDNFASDE